MSRCCFRFEYLNDNLFHSVLLCRSVVKVNASVPFGVKGGKLDFIVLVPNVGWLVGWFWV